MGRLVGNGDNLEISTVSRNISMTCSVDFI